MYFACDATGRRVRKAYEHGAFVEERIYLDGYELYRKRSLADGALALERQTLAIGDEAAVVALVESKTVDTGVPAFTPITRVRFQLTDQLGTTTTELDEAGAVFSYEEYYPFGATAWRASSSATEVSARRYRYLGKERDEETGLYALGLRYYAAWLGRWTSPDPAGYVDGLNLYRYARNNPIILRDPTGTDSTPGVFSQLQGEIRKVFAPRAVAAAPAAATAPAAVTGPAAAAGGGGGAATGAVALGGVVVTGAAVAGTGYVTFSRSNAIAQTGNPWGVRNPGMGILRYSHQ